MAKKTAPKKVTKSAAKGVKGGAIKVPGKTQFSIEGLEKSYEQ